jgi:hypothetical protein
LENVRVSRVFVNVRVSRGFHKTSEFRVRFDPRGPVSQCERQAPKKVSYCRMGETCEKRRSVDSMRSITKLES